MALNWRNIFNFFFRILSDALYVLLKVKSILSLIQNFFISEE